MARTVRIMFNKQTTPTFPVKVPCKLCTDSKTTAHTCIRFSKSDWIILALSNHMETRKR